MLFVWLFALGWLFALASCCTICCDCILVIVHALDFYVFYLVSVVIGALTCDWFGYAVIVFFLFVA